MDLVAADAGCPARATRSRNEERVVRTAEDGRRVLAHALEQDWDAGAERLWYGQLPDEVADDPDLGPVLEEIDGSTWDRHGRLFRLLEHLDPDRAPTYRGVTIDRRGLASVATDAVRDGSSSTAAALVASIRDQQVLPVLAQRGDGAWAAELQRRWSLAHEDLDEQLTIHGERGSLVATGGAEVADAMLLQLLTDPSAADRLRGQLTVAIAPGEQPPWFRAALGHDARPSRLLAAGLLLPQVRRQVAETATVDTGDDAADATTRIPPVRPQAGAPGEAAGARPSGTGTGPQAPAGSSGRAPGHPQGQEPHRRTSEPTTSASPSLLTHPAITAVAERATPAILGLTLAAAALRWPLLTAMAVLLWLVVDRLVSWLADPFLRLAGGWPPQVHGMALVMLPFRALGLALRAPWRVVADVVLFAVGLVLVDRLLVGTHIVLDSLLSDGMATGRDELVARWFVPLWAGGVVAWAAYRRRSSPPLRGIAFVAGALRRTPIPARAGALAAAVVLFLVSVAAPAAGPWAPYEDHRDAFSALTPGGTAWEGVRGTVDRIADTEADGSDTTDDASESGADAGTRRLEVVDASALRVRAGAGTDQPVIGTLAPGDVVVATGGEETVDADTWFEIELDDGTVGWSSGQYLRPTD